MGVTTRPELELFGEWQTSTYVPPVAQDGIVPCNEYGNVDLFKPEMLPIGCVHIIEPNAARLCKKLSINYAEAITGKKTFVRMKEVKHCICRFRCTWWWITSGDRRYCYLSRI